MQLIQRPDEVFTNTWKSETTKIIDHIMIHEFANKKKELELGQNCLDWHGCWTGLFCFTTNWFCIDLNHLEHIKKGILFNGRIFLFRHMKENVCQRKNVVCVLTTRVLIRTIITIFFSVTEQTTFNTSTISTSKETILTKWLISNQQWLYFTFLVLAFAVLDGIFPITSLFLNIKI